MISKNVEVKGEIIEITADVVRIKFDEPLHIKQDEDLTINIIAQKRG